MRPFPSVPAMVLLSALGVTIGACGNADVTSTTMVSTTAVSTSGTTSGDDTTTTTSIVTTTAPLATQTVQVAFATSDGDCSEVAVFERQVDATLDPLEASFRTLVAGPSTEEEAQGAGSIFSEETAGTVQSVTLEDGLLVVDFSDFRVPIANASTSCGSMSLLSQLNATAFQFEEVERVIYAIEGSCDLFSNWLQRDCMQYSRDGAELAQP